MEEIYGFYLTDSPQTFRLKRMGEYRIILLGGAYIFNGDNFCVELLRKDTNELIPTDKPWLLSGRILDWNPACIYRTFYIDKGGEFEIRFRNSEELQLISMQPSITWPLFFPWKRINPKKVWVSIQYNQL